MWAAVLLLSILFLPLPPVHRYFTPRSGRCHRRQSGYCTPVRNLSQGYCCRKIYSYFAVGRFAVHVIRYAFLSSRHVLRLAVFYGLLTDLFGRKKYRNFCITTPFIAHLLKQSIKFIMALKTSFMSICKSYRFHLNIFLNLFAHRYLTRKIPNNKLGSS